MLKKRQGQSTVEYAVLIAVVVGALLAMQIYVKRGAMGKLRTASDQVGDQFTPLKYTGKFSNTFDATRKDTVSVKGVSRSQIINVPETTKRGTAVPGGVGEEHITQKLSDEKLF